MYKIIYYVKKFFRILRPSILEGNKELILFDIEDEYGGRNIIKIPSYISFEVRLLTDVLLYINLFLLFLAFVYPQMFQGLEFIRNGITFRYPHPIALTNWAIFSFFFWVFSGLGIIALYRKLFKVVKQ